MTDEPFGRQPLPVTVSLEGDRADTEFWLRELMRRAEFKGDTAKRLSGTKFVIYPRAVND